MDMSFVLIDYFGNARQGDGESDLSGERGERAYRGGQLSVFLLGLDARSQLVRPSRKMGGTRLYGNLLSRALSPCFFNVFQSFLN